MEAKELKKYQDSIKDEIVSIFENSFFNLEFLDPSVEIKGHYWLIKIVYIYDDFEKIIQNNIYKFIKSDENTNDGDINHFFKKNEELYDEIMRMKKIGSFDSLFPVLREIETLLDDADQQAFEICIDARFNSDDSFKNHILEENICGFSFRDDDFFLGGGMVERKYIHVPEGNNTLELSVPIDKVQYFPRAFQAPTNPISDTSNYIFVIMSFQADPVLTDVFNAITRAAKKWNRKVIVERVDLIDGDFKITDKIIECIKRSDLIIADLTGERPNVYYELGYAMALNKKVIRTAKIGTNLHFDVKDLNTIFWANATQIEKDILKRLRNMAKNM